MRTAPPERKAMPRLARRNRDKRRPVAIVLLTAGLTLGGLMLGLTLLGSTPPAVSAQPRPAAKSKSRPPAAAHAGLDLAAVAAQVIEQTNEFRREQGRSPVAANAELEATARRFAEFMARSNVFGHTADGASAAERAKAQGYRACAIAENIAYYYSAKGFDTPTLTRYLMQGWRNSPGHRENMLDPTMTETGVALARSPTTGYYYAVQLFGQPIRYRIQFEISNNSTAVIHYASGGRSWSLPPGYIQTHQQCKPVELVFDWPGQQEETRIQPIGGDRYAIVQNRAGQFTLKPH